jgi:carboxyl-terminal processing protease
MIKKFNYLLLILCILSACRQDSGQNNGESATRIIESLLPEIMEKIRQDYIEPVDEQKLAEGALNGLLTTLDPFSVYLNQKDFQLLTDATKGEFAGVGLEIIATKGIIKVIAAIDDTPAYKAGIKAGDVISHINGQEVHKLSPNNALQQLQGEEGTEISLTILRKDLESFVVKLKRSVIKVNPVKFMIKQDVAYIRIASFNENATGKLHEALQKLSVTPDINGLILDLRNNPGGTLEQAVEVASSFLDSGVIVDIKSRNSDYNQTIRTINRDLIKGVPMVVLINKGSASASEIVAGALKDHKRAIVMGTQSFGKGSVQTLFSIPGYGGFKLTTASFYTPKGNAIQNKGIEPDILVEEDETSVKKEDIKPPFSELPVDYQMQRAIDLLRGLSVFQMKG